jgi:hypothetical protein
MSVSYLVNIFPYFRWSLKNPMGACGGIIDVVDAASVKKYGFLTMAAKSRYILFRLLDMGRHRELAFAETRKEDDE